MTGRHRFSAIIVAFTVGAGSFACAPSPTPVIVSGTCAWVADDWQTPSGPIISGQPWYVSIGIQVRVPLTQTQAAIRLISESLGDTADMLVTTNFGGEWATPEQPTIGYLNPPIPVPAGTEILVRLTGTAGPASGPAEIRSDVFADQIAGVYEVRCANSVVAPLGST